MATQKQAKASQTRPPGSATQSEELPPERTSVNSRTRRMRLRAAWMYFIEEMTQNEIANQLGVGRVTVVRLLSDARERNEVKFSIQGGLEDCVELARALERRFGLDEAIVVPVSSPDTDATLPIAAATGMYVSELVQAGLKIAMLMYEENARKINQTLEAINPAATQDIIALGKMESMLEARDKLDQGYLVGMLADRALGDDLTVDHEFLGELAPFPVGPFRMAAMLRRPVFFMTGLYLGGNRYQIHFEPLADFSATTRENREQAIFAAQQHYADRLSHFCRIAPYNWFNFFDFWQKKS